MTPGPSAKDAPDAAVDFVKYLLSDEVQKGFAERDMGLPTNPAATGSVKDPALGGLLKVRDEAPYVQLYFDTAFGQSVGGAMNDEIALMFAGKASPQDIVDEDAAGGGRREVTAVTRTAAPGASTGAADSVAGRAPARPAPRGGGVPAGAGRRCGWRWRSLFFVGPALLLFSVFVVWPIVRAVQFSLYRWKGFGPLVDFVGPAELRRRCCSNEVFIDAFTHNMVIVVLSILVQLPLGPGDRPAAQPEDARPGPAAHHHLRARTCSPR